MKNYSKSYPGRKMRVWWYADTDNYKTVQLQGFDCGNSSAVWWCPQIGSSVSENHHLFKTKGEAHAKVLKAARDEFERLAKDISRLEREQ